MTKSRNAEARVLLLSVRRLSRCKAQHKFTAGGQGQLRPSQQTLLMVSITNDSLLKGEANKPDKQVKLSVRLISSINRTHSYLSVRRV